MSNKPSLKIYHRTIELSSRKEWTTALYEIPSFPTHNWDYCHAMELNSGFRTRLHVFETCPKERCVIPLCERQKEQNKLDLVTPYGFGGFIGTQNLLTSPALKKAFFDYCLSQGYVTAYIQQHPLFPLSTTIWGQHLETNHELYQLDLTNELNELWKNMSKGHKYALKKTMHDADCHVELDQGILKANFKKLYLETLERTRASAVYSFPEKSLDILLNSPNSLLLGIRDKKAVQAISLFLYTSVSGEYFLNATTEIGRNYSRHLIWLAIKKFKEMNIRSLNLGGGIKKGDSLADFKRRFGGYTLLAQTLKIIFFQQTFQDLCERYCGNDFSSAVYFPPYWQ